MTGQLDWVENPPAPYAKGSDTSREAAESLSNTATMRGCVLNAIKLRGALGATDQELQELLHLPPNCETPRRWELVNMGLVRNSGQRRKNRSGRSAAVWMLT